MTRRVSHRVFRRLKDSKGTSLVEAALITPLLLLLTFGICEFASLFYVYLALENGVSQAARFGVTGNVSPGLSREDSIRKAMRDATPTLTIEDGDFTFTHMAPGGASWLAGSGDPGDVSRVQVTHHWGVLTPVLREFFASNMVTIKVESAMLNEPRFD